MELISYSTYALITASHWCLTKHPLHRNRPKVNLQKLLIYWLLVLKLVHLCFCYSCLAFYCFCLFVVDPFMLFDLLNFTRNNSWRAWWPPVTPRIHSVHTNSVLHYLMRYLKHNCKVRINFLNLWKCPSSSAVFTSVTSRYHENFILFQNLVTHFISSEIGACLLLLWSYTWWI